MNLVKVKASLSSMLSVLQDFLLLGKLWCGKQLLPLHSRVADLNFNCIFLLQVFWSWLGFRQTSVLLICEFLTVVSILVLEPRHTRCDPWDKQL